MNSGPKTTLERVARRLHAAATVNRECASWDRLSLENHMYWIGVAMEVRQMFEYEGTEHDPLMEGKKPTKDDHPDVCCVSSEELATFCELCKQPLPADSPLRKIFAQRREAIPEKLAKNDHPEIPTREKLREIGREAIGRSVLGNFPEQAAEFAGQAAWKVIFGVDPNPYFSQPQAGDWNAIPEKKEPEKVQPISASNIKRPEFLPPGPKVQYLKEGEVRKVKLISHEQLEKDLDKALADEPKGLGSKVFDTLGKWWEKAWPWGE